ncbi:hypothetical protein AB6Q85_003302 [Vibrio cholerae]
MKSFVLTLTLLFTLPSFADTTTESTKSYEEMSEQLALLIAKADKSIERLTELNEMKGASNES